MGLIPIRLNSKKLRQDRQIAFNYPHPAGGLEQAMLRRCGFRRLMGEETAMAAKPFRTSFLDGFTGEGIFGDLRLPGSPTRMFISEQEAAAEAPAEVRSGTTIDGSRHSRVDSDQAHHR
jgi:hypothetical protein